MEKIINYSLGKLSHNEFEAILYTDVGIWMKLQSLVTDDIKNKSDFKERYPSVYMRLDTNSFSVRSTISAFGFDDDFGKSIAHDLISSLVEYNYPQVQRSKPIDTPEDLLDELELWFVGGEEVDLYLRDYLLRVGKQNKTNLKRGIKELFHISGSKYPKWVQDPEWPMSNGIPMKFVSQQTDGEFNSYVFEDVTTKDKRVIKQFS